MKPKTLRAEIYHDDTTRVVRLKPAHDCLSLYAADGSFLLSIFQDAVNPGGIVVQYFPKSDKTKLIRGHGC